MHRREALQSPPDFAVDTAALELLISTSIVIYSHLTRIRLFIGQFLCIQRSVISARPIVQPFESCVDSKAHGTRVQRFRSIRT